MPIDYRAYFARVTDLKQKVFNSLDFIKCNDLPGEELTLEKNVVAYEQIFYTLAGDGIFSRSQSPSRSEDVFPTPVETYWAVFKAFSMNEIV